MINLFDIKAWGDWAIRTVFAFGFFSVFVFAGMQIWGWELVIEIPRIESSFIKHK